MNLRENPGSQFKSHDQWGELARRNPAALSLQLDHSGQCEYVTGFPADPGPYAPQGPAVDPQSGKWKGAY